MVAGRGEPSHVLELSTGDAEVAASGEWWVWRPDACLYAHATACGKAASVDDAKADAEAHMRRYGLLANTPVDGD